MDEASYLVFYETWYALAESRDTDAKRLAFYDTIFRYYFEGVEPQKPIRGESPGEAWAAWDAFLVAKPVIDNRRKKIEAGRAGGLAGRGKSRNNGNQNARKTPDEPARKQAEIKSKTIANQKQINSRTIANQKGALDINKNIKEESITSNMPTGLITKSMVFNRVCDISAQGALTHAKNKNDEVVEAEDGMKTGGDMPQNERPVTCPSDGELMEAARQMQIPVDYIPAFVADMQRLGWGYINRGGVFVALNRRNCKAIISSFWRNRKKELTKTANNPADTIGVKIEATDDYENRF